MTAGSLSYPRLPTAAYQLDIPRRLTGVDEYAEC